MANTVSILSYANTFGEWVVITDALANEVNNLGKGTFTKDTGTMILLGSSESLRANGPANFYSTLSVLGIGSSAYIQNNLTVGGSLITGGPVSWYANTITLGAGVANSAYSYINVNRSPSANASIRYNNSLNYWDMLDVTNGTYYRLLTTQLMSDSTLITSSTTVASATAANVAYRAGMTAQAAAAVASAAAAGAVNKVNGTSGQATASNGSVTISGANGITSIASSNTITISTSQDLRTSASPSFSGLILYGNLSANGYLISSNVIVANTISASSVVSSPILKATSSATMVTLGVNTAADTANSGSIVATGKITAYYSDERLKVNLGNIPNALDKVISLNGFYYEANKIAQELGYIAKREVGVSAQEVQKVLPEVVSPAPINQEYLTVDYERIVPLLIEAIKELKLEIDLLKSNQ